MEWHLSTWNEWDKADMYRCLALRIEVFVIEQNCPYQDADGKDFHSDHLYCKNEVGDVVAYARVVHPGISYEEYSIGRVVNSEKVRGTGIGRVLMQKAIRSIFEKNGPVPIRISAQCYLEKFYHSLGFEPIGEPYPEDNIPHIEMLLAQAY